MYIFDDILISKIQSPQIGFIPLERSRLLNKFEQNSKLTLISAPAGYGKTVLVTQFAELSTSSTCWYQLDYHDNNFNLFILHLLKGLERLIPNLIEDFQHILIQGNNPKENFRQLITLLINILSYRLKQQTTLIFENYHVIEDEIIHKFLEQLLLHLPPKLHIIITSRFKPPLNLEHLKIAGLINEIYKEDLKFTQDEISSFLKEESQNIKSIEIIEFLEEKTEGWPAALRLVKIAISKSNFKQEVLFNKLLPDSDKIFNYFAVEVLNQIPDELRTFVLSTSVLDIMTPQICDLFLDRTDSRRLLKEVEDRNIFITNTEGEEQIYRYHSLFKNFLQKQLTSTEKIYFFEKGGQAYQELGYLPQAMECFLKAENHKPVFSKVKSECNKTVKQNALPKEIITYFSQQRISETTQMFPPYEYLPRYNLNRINRKTDIQVNCLGPLRVYVNEEEITWRTKKAKELFAYLFHHREKPVSKDKLLEQLWPEFPPDKASVLFHTNLYQLRRVIKTTTGEQPVIHKNKMYQLKNDLLSSDLQNFLLWGEPQQHVSETPQEFMTRLEQASSYYQGDYLEDIDFPWAEAEREHLSQKFQLILEKLSNCYYEHGNYNLAASCLRRILQNNPLLEDIHTNLMKVYAQAGDRMAVMQQYQTLNQVLNQELGIEPSPKTRDIYYNLCSESEKGIN